MTGNIKVIHNYNLPPFHFLSYADSEQLQVIYGSYLRPVIHHSLSSHPVWGAVRNIQALAQTMVSIYEQVF